MTLKNGNRQIRIMEVMVILIARNVNGSALGKPYFALINPVLHKNTKSRGGPAEKIAIDLRLGRDKNEYRVGVKVTRAGYLHKKTNFSNIYVRRFFQLTLLIDSELEILISESGGCNNEW